ncbi:LacI family DNA-binding transcriptional regulator [Streptomyces ipomoeae]|nr:LacI family DNA-binding transcriptional regulator [Streptomyces ipomoeae]MDX2697279.1 LacI family DNA-binding transcriptional regulator [Streptomyces ipomoeae]MDX2824821.1 LacI family DNA-binding transcriptional regulator [Streptomyces ipomoeae]MDX2843074.1 LacI family DNA-binding transcriptional regulator [Streptomyces ipomoeae]MDX2877413.1 LacI family DNA-binding transcriptional regulator [Streptomyces ipomoeae]MDX2934590.1 LacI family DNA-binding transcriptional regulator [Streptomyces i
MVKITDVARHAGVSPSTVSYALSGKRPISAETRARVEASIRELGYRPHAGARALASNKSNVLAMVVPLRPGINVPVVMQFAVSVVTTAREHDHDVLLLTQEEGEEGLRRVADTALVDAFIVMDVQLHDPRIPLLRALDRPSVMIGFPAEPSGLTCIDLDFKAAGELCVEHLAGLGHRVIGLVGSPPEVYVRQTAFAQRVVQGFTAAATRHRITSTVHPCEATPAAARQVAERLLREHPALTGVVVHNEAILEPLMDAFEQLGLRVPADLSLTALCPDALAETLPVPVTSIAIPSAEVGVKAVDLLMKKLSGTQVPQATLLSPRLTIRASTARRHAP